MAVIILISGGVREASNNILGGINAYPNNRRDAWLTARLEVDADAPNGYEYDPNFTTTRYVDDSIGNPIYVSQDGATYSIGNEIISAAYYDSSGRTSFQATFNQYWDQSQP